MAVLKTKNLLKISEKEYLFVFDLLDEALSLLSERSVEALDQLVKLGKRIVKKTPHFLHAYLILTIAYYRKREYAKAFKFGEKALIFYLDPAIIPTLEYIHLRYDNHFHFLQTVRDIYEEEAEKIRVDEYFIRVEHHRQEEALLSMEMIAELISFKDRFVYPQTVFFSQNDFHELLESCGLDMAFHIVSKEINECPIEKIHDHVQHIWTNSNNSLIIFTEYDPFFYYKEEGFAGFILIEGDFKGVTQFNALLYDHIKEFKPIKGDYRQEFYMPLKDKWVPGRFFRE